MRLMKPFTLKGHLEHMACPYLVLHGGHDVLTVTAARSTYDYAKAHGVDATLRVLDPEETGAEHCQHDNPTIGQEVLADWLADRFGIDQRALLRSSINPSDMRRAMNLGVDHPRAAVVAIDLHRGHLDMAVATMPTTPDVATPRSSPPTSGCSTGAAASTFRSSIWLTYLSRCRGNPRQSVLAHPRRGSRPPPART